MQTPSPVPSQYSLASGMGDGQGFMSSGGQGFTSGGASNLFGQDQAIDGSQSGQWLQLGDTTGSGVNSNLLGQNLADNIPQVDQPQAPTSYGLSSGSGTGQGLSLNGGLSLNYQGMSVQGGPLGGSSANLQNAAFALGVSLPQALPSDGGGGGDDVSVDGEAGGASGSDVSAAAQESFRRSEIQFEDSKAGMAQMYGAGVTIPASGDGIQLPDGSIATGKALDAYNKAYAQNPDVGGAEDAALGSMIADKVTDLRQQIQSGQISDSDGTLAAHLNVVTDALMSKDAYYANGISELLPAGVQRLWTDAELAPLNINAQMLQPKDGSDFMAGAYYDANRSMYVIADRGTATMEGWITNGRQALALSTQQYFDAVQIALKANTSDAGVSGQIEYTGHSLGGGLASLQALIGNAPAVTFNASGLNSATAANYGADINGPNHIDAYYVNGEILSGLQDHTPLPSAIGNRIPLTADGQIQITPNGLSASAPLTGWQTFTNTVNLHFMGSVESSLYDRYLSRP